MAAEGINASGEFLRAMKRRNEGLPALPTTRYSIAIKGEVGTYNLGVWNSITWDTTCTLLSDLTGYRTEYLKRELPGAFDRLGYCHVNAATASPGQVPVFLIRSSDGRVPRGT